MKVIIRLVIFGALVTSLFPFIDRQDIKIVDGIEIIQNKKSPDPPQGALTKLVLELETFIGESDDLEKSFSQLGGFVVDDEGMIYAAGNVLYGGNKDYELNKSIRWIN